MAIFYFITSRTDMAMNLHETYREIKRLEKLVALKKEDAANSHCSDPSGSLSAENRTLALMLITLCRRLPEGDKYREEAIAHLTEKGHLNPLRENVELNQVTCSRCEGKGWSWEYAHPLVGFDMKWRKCHCPKGETEPKPKRK